MLGSQMDLTPSDPEATEDEFRQLSLNDLDDIEDDVNIEASQKKVKKGLFGMGRVGKGIAKRSAKIGGWFASSSSTSTNDETQEIKAIVLGCRWCTEKMRYGSLNRAKSHTSTSPGCISTSTLLAVAL